MSTMLSVDQADGGVVFDWDIYEACLSSRFVFGGQQSCCKNKKTLLAPNVAAGEESC